MLRVYIWDKSLLNNWQKNKYVTVCGNSEQLWNNLITKTWNRVKLAAKFSGFKIFVHFISVVMRALCREVGVFGFWYQSYFFFCTFSGFNVMDIVDIINDPERCNLPKNLMAIETELSGFWILSVLGVHLYILHDVITPAAPTACSN